ncbi:hypothetical protein GCM10010403_24510 [Glycomyces rutgersensis]|uniref:Uncharacterized protein n=2 Tax=Glycomyces TaxID=58113 RepID=A0ABU2ANS5_9ACTN|nr:hypothetical protein [Glycomyces lechevalierae]
MSRREHTTREVKPLPERRFPLGAWFENRAKTVVGAFWFPDAQEIRELRGRAVATIATTSAETDPEIAVSWLESCPYSEGKKTGLARQLKRLHRNLVEYRACEG